MTALCSSDQTPPAWYLQTQSNQSEECMVVHLKHSGIHFLNPTLSDSLPGCEVKPNSWLYCASQGNFQENYLLVLVFFLLSFFFFCCLGIFRSGESAAKLETSHNTPTSNHSLLNPDFSCWTHLQTMIKNKQLRLRLAQQLICYQLVWCFNLICSSYQQPNIQAFEAELPHQSTLCNPKKKKWKPRRDCEQIPLKAP